MSQGNETQNTASQEDAPHIEGERTIPSINHPRYSGKNIMPVIMLGATIALAVLYMAGAEENKPENPSGKETQIRQSRVEAPELELPEPVIQSAPLPTARPMRIEVSQEPPPLPDEFDRYQGRRQKSPEEMIIDRKLAGEVLLYSNSGGRSGQKSGPSVYDDPGQADPVAEANRIAAQYLGQNDSPEGYAMPAPSHNTLDVNMKAAKFQGARAGVLPERNLILTKGAFMDCALETAIDSSVPGMTSCRVTHDIYSSNGKVILIDRGSRVTGQYQSSLKHGQARLFVLWERVETPYGVVIDVESPGTDALGRSGHAGYVKTHFWKRFGGAVLLSLVDDLGEYAANKGRDDEDSIYFGSTGETAQDAASIALENSINIPPTLRKNQGDHISIFVARDLDFSSVYELAAQHTQP